MTARTMFLIASSFGVEVGDLMPIVQVPAAPIDLRWAALRMAGWRVTQADGEQPQKDQVPVYDLAAAAGPASDVSATPAILAWA